LATDFDARLEVALVNRSRCLIDKEECVVDRTDLRALLDGAKGLRAEVTRLIAERDARGNIEAFKSMADEYAQIDEALQTPGWSDSTLGRELSDEELQAWRLTRIADLKQTEAKVTQLRDDLARLQTDYSATRQRCDDLTADLAVNAHMLAQQCDLAREAEAKALQAAERMRERCVVEADRQGDHCEMTSNRQGQAAAERIAANIRALPVEEP
jgi:DNA repair exonuclease SbcCD ATPase subunit